VAAALDGFSCRGVEGTRDMSSFAAARHALPAAAAARTIAASVVSAPESAPAALSRVDVHLLCYMAVVPAGVCT
jgi:hypothetical protein